MTGEASPATWSEALGAGGLGSLGLVEFRHGRACLAGAVGDFLDERAPSAVELIGVGRHRAPRPGQAQQIGEGVAAARDHAVRLADELGQVALAANPGALAQARLEAWLRGLALVVVGDPGPLVLRPDEAVIAVVPLAVGRSV